MMTAALPVLAAITCSMLLPLTPPGARVPGVPTHARRRADQRLLRAAGKQDNVPDNFAGTLDERSELVDDGVIPEETPPEVIRPPPDYPEGLHEAAKADRTGPFWSSLGEPDVSTGVRPSYLRRDDWHISSTYTAEERAAVEGDEQAYIESLESAAVTVEVPEEEEEEEDWQAFFAEKEFMETEPGPPAQMGKKSEHTMPDSWQDYQTLQERVAELASREALSADERAAAAHHEEELNGFYVTFKDVIELGWTLNNNDAVSEAMSFAQKYYKNTD